MTWIMQKIAGWLGIVSPSRLCAEFGARIGSELERVLESGSEFEDEEDDI
jgi:hypothetical protein